MFVPAAYRAVDDFSDEWWSLVHSSPWFRDYWLQERFQDPQSIYFDTAVDVDLDFEEDDDDDLQPLFGSNNTALKRRFRLQTARSVIVLLLSFADLMDL